MHRSRFVRLVAALVAIAALALVAACSSSTSTLTTTATKGGTITGSWNASMVNGGQVPGGSAQITATFQNGTISGFSGVNTYSGPYTAGSDGAFKAGPLVATQKAGPPEAMQLETGYLAALGKAVTYSAANGQLTLFGADGAPLVKYAAPR